MKKVLATALVGIIILSIGWLLFNCDINIHPVIGQLDENDAQRYTDIVRRMYNNEEITSKKEISNEYTFINSRSLFAIEFIRIVVLEDNTGIAFCSFKDGGVYIDKGEIIYNKQIELTENQTRKIIKLIEKNDFWNIPSVHPDEELGFDGNTIYIEGKTGEKYNIISMWCPLKKHKIRKIYEGVINCCNDWGMEFPY